MKMKEVNYQLIGRVVGVLFAIGGWIISLLIISSVRNMPNPQLVPIVFIIFGFAGYALYVYLPRWLERVVLRIASIESKMVRVYLFAVGMWGLAEISYLILFYDFRYGVSEDEVLLALKIFLFPSALAGIGVYGYERFFKER